MMHASAVKRSASMGLAALVVFAAFFTTNLAHAPNADAGTFGFCGNVMLGPESGSGAQSWCQSGLVTTYQAYAWGEHSVCIEIEPLGSTRACSSGTNGVYSGEDLAGYGYPTISNHTNTNNYASGVYFTH